MKEAFLAVLLLLIPSLTGAMDMTSHQNGNYLSFLSLPRSEQPKELDTLYSSKVPSVLEAKDVAFKAWKRGIPAYPLEWNVVGLYRAGLGGIAGFAAPGHWVWEVHFQSNGLGGIVLINAQTKEVYVFPLASTP